MGSELEQFEAAARASSAIAVAHTITAVSPPSAEVVLHPFDQRNVHPSLPPKVRKLFDDGYYPEATFEAFKFLDKYVQKHAKSTETGYKLMMAAFDDAKPLISLTPLKSVSEIDEQKGYRFIFAGGVWAIRNPRGHEHSVVDTPDVCLDHLSFVSMLLRRLELAGFK